MPRTIWKLVFCVLTASAALRCQGATIWASENPGSSKLDRNWQFWKCSAELKIAETEFQKKLPTFPEYQEARRRLNECDVAIEALLGGDESPQLDLELANKRAARNELASVADSLKAKDPRIASLRAKMADLQKDNNVYPRQHLQSQYKPRKPRRPSLKDLFSSAVSGLLELFNDREPVSPNNVIPPSGRD